MRSTITFLLTLSICLNSLFAQQDLGKENLEFDEQKDQHFVPGELLLTFSSFDKSKGILQNSKVVSAQDERLDRLLKKYQVWELNGIPTIDSMFLIRCEGCDAKSLQRELSDLNGIFKYVELNYVYELINYSGLSVSPNDPVSNQSLLNQISAQPAWDLSKGDNSVVGLIDQTGNGLTNQDITPKVLSNQNLSGYTSTSHGHWMGGLIGAATNNNLGIPSIGYNAKLRTYNIGTNSSAVTSQHMASAVNQARLNGVNVINMSFTWSNSGSLKDAVDYAKQSGITVVTAAGNDSYNGGCSSSSVICITSVDQNDAHAPTNNKSNSAVDLSAPDRGYQTLGPGGTNIQGMFRGTSQSTALVSGTAALMYHLYPNITPYQVEQFLECSADDISNVSNNGTTYNGLIGSGRLNVYRAVEQVKILLGSISGPIYVSPNNDYNYSVPYYSGVNYTWSVSGAATLVYGQYSNSVYVRTASSASTYQVQCTIKKGDCSQTKSFVSFNDGNKVSSFQVKTYPNPTSGDFTAAVVEVQDVDDDSKNNDTGRANARFELYDPFGQLVRSVQSRSQAQIQMANLKKGFYTLRVTRDNESIVQRIELR